MYTLTDDDSRNSFTDGIFANMFATLTGGAFLTGLALHLGMDEFMIGLLGAIPFIVTVFQLPTSYLVQRYDVRKKTCVMGAAIARIAWLPILIAAFVPMPFENFRLYIILFLFLISHASASISHLAWLSWMSDLIPDNIRGSFFGARNMLIGAGGMIAMMVFGKILDLSKNHLNNGVPIGLSVTFLFAILFGAASLRFLNKVYELPSVTSHTPVSFWSNLNLPLKEANFRRFLAFAFCWSFAVYFASPFFTLYFLKNLNFSYTFVAVLGTLSALADLLGMRVWGKLSDRVKNKSIIQLASWVAVFAPFAWVSVRPGSWVAPIIIHIVAGGFWAGINLCTNNLLLRISPTENKGIFFSTYSVIAGAGAVVAPITAGFLLRIMPEAEITIFDVELLPLHLVFMASTLMRFASRMLLKSVIEPDAAPVSQLVRILRNVRGLNVANGFNSLLHPFVEIVSKKNNNKVRA